MRELIIIQLGAAGNKIAEAFWDVMCFEHGVDMGGNFYGTSSLQLQQINVVFNEVNKKYFPRAICADTDRNGILKLKTGPLGHLFSPENLIYSREGTGNNFAKGYLTEGSEIMDPLLDVIRREAENADCLQGFILTHAIGGGTGSGMGSLLLRCLADEYPDNLTNSFTIFPSSTISDIVVEPYNCVLSIPQLIENCHQTFCLDNGALHEICVKNLNLPSSSFNDMNHIIARTMSGITTCYRFPGQLNSSLRKLHVNMTPFPNVHFFAPGLAPFTSCVKIPYRNLSVPELIMKIFSNHNNLVDIDMRKGKYLTAAAIFRGVMSTKDVDVSMMSLRAKNHDNFIPWIPNNIKTAICDIPPKGLKLSATFVANTTAIRYFFSKYIKSFQALFKRKANLHWYLGEGLDEEELKQAETSLKDLITEYKSYETEMPNEDEEKGNINLMPACKF